MGSFIASIALLDKEHVRVVIFHDKDLARRLAALLQTGSVKRKVDPLPGFGFDPDPAMIPVNDPLTDRQPDAGA